MFEANTQKNKNTVNLFKSMAIPIFYLTYMLKILLPVLFAVVIVFSSCSRESSPDTFKPKTDLGNEYNGGLFPVWINLKDKIALKDSGNIDWITGTSQIAYRTRAVNDKDLITADTAFLFWNTTPEAFVKIDSTKIKGTEEWKYDTATYYRDTVYAVVNGKESEPFVIEVKNIIHRIKSITVSGIVHNGDSVITIAAHPGTQMELSIELENPFNAANRPNMEMPPEMGTLVEKSRTNEQIVYQWIVPNKPFSGMTNLSVTGSRTQGKRTYKINLVVYTDFGSIWAASEKEIVKYSPEGAEVARIKGDFKSISDIAVNSKNGNLFVVDQGANAVSIYDTYGNNIYKSEGEFTAPTSAAIEAVDGSVWIADETGLGKYAFRDSTLGGSSTSYPITGQIKSISINQFNNFIWFAQTKENKVGFINAATEEIPNTWNRPSVISVDHVSGAAWVADSSGITAVDINKNILATIKGFGFVSSVYANNNNIWVSDILNRKVYRFKASLKSGQMQNLTIADGLAIGGFLSPVFVSAYNEDGSVWVVDKGAGMVVKLDALGKRIASGTGLELPNIGKTIQIVE